MLLLIYISQMTLNFGNKEIMQWDRKRRGRRREGRKRAAKKGT